ncbi:MAG: hypothetical protein LBN05_07790 [Oscillospiraceae bacterium]|jgi:outer membrane murein-binding lipoprotein Lpp|nr:hypothetical protein [Oscillospiraceae bacterium]
MAQETHLRAALFGGFHKTDVLAYIETLQNQILALQGEQQQRSRELPAMREQVQALTAELEQARARERGFFDNTEELQRQLIVLEQDRDALRAQLNSANAGHARVKNVEGQVGTLILDALLYSEKIIGRAKETAAIIANRAQTSVEGTAAEVDGLGEDMTQISRDLSDSISQLVGRIKGVAGDLSGMAEQLEPDLRDGSEQYEFDVTGQPVLRAQAEDDVPASEGADDKDQITFAQPTVPQAATAPVAPAVPEVASAPTPAPLPPAPTAPAPIAPPVPEAPPAQIYEDVHSHSSSVEAPDAIPVPVAPSPATPPASPDAPKPDFPPAPQMDFSGWFGEANDLPPTLDFFSNLDAPPPEQPDDEY